MELTSFLKRILFEAIGTYSNSNKNLHDEPTKEVFLENGYIPAVFEK